jgi:ClpP class serine protease
MLAIKPEALHSGPQGFFWLFGGGAKASERIGEVAIVHIRDALDHHDDSFGDNYESIATRVRDAMTGADMIARHKVAQERHRWHEGYREGYVPLADIEQTKPSVCVLEIDSPGGVVSGLNETSAKIVALSKEHGVPLVTYVNEMAASAAYALACAAPKIYAPRSSISGSIGVISTMASQHEADRADGLDYRLITSGARKADGHPHAPISDAAVNAERKRVMSLAKDFWRLASKARGVPMRDIQALEAGIYLGPEAERRGLIDGVMSRDELLVSLSKAPKSAKKSAAPAEPEASGNETDRRATEARSAQLAHQRRAMCARSFLR